MATTDETEGVREHVGHGVPKGGGIPITPPLSADPSCLDGVVPNHRTFQADDQAIGPPHLKGNDRLYAENQSLNPNEDQMRTPKLEHPPWHIYSLTSKVLKPLQIEDHQQYRGNREKDIVISGNLDYFTPNVPQGSFVDDISRTPSSSNLSSTGLSGSTNSQRDTSSTPVSPDTRANAWKDYTPSFNPESNRPVSVPNFHSKPLSRRRDGPDYPNYPDQSFKALQNQHYPPPYQPGEPHHLRTRSSHPSQNLSFSSSDEIPARAYPQIPSGAKTVGNTPAQSPGLFTPMVSKKHCTGEPDETRSVTPMLHPAHLQAPKETHKLLKDIDPISGRKTINHYELMNKLGSGNHGTVKLARDLITDTLCAVKIVRRFSKTLRLGRSGDPNDMIKKEVAILKKARHPNVVSLLEVIDDDEWGKVYLALELVERGEIVWRKPTDKDVALFEMERCKRELANGLSDDHERAAIAVFNKSAPSRRQDKARRLADQKRRDQERFGSGGARREPQSPRLDPYFSLEYGGESEDEAGAESLGQIPAQIQGGKRPTDKPMPSNTTDDSPQSTPTHTSKPVSHSIHAASTRASVSSSRPETPAQHEGPESGSQAKETAKDVELRSLLNTIILGQNDWDPIDENFRYVPCLTLTQALDAFRDTVLGLEYLHYQGIIHRDIKPANLLWTTGFRVKISDFGVSYLGKPIREDDNDEDIAELDAEIHDEAIELAKTVGTPAFYAPELCDPQYFEVGGDSERPAITGQIDVWALGVTLYAMVFGRLPFFNSNQFLMYEKIARDDVFIPRMRLKGVPHEIESNAFGTVTDRRKRFDDILEYEDVNDELRDLLKRLLEKKPSKRITLKEVKHHPWVLQGITDRTLWLDETDPSLQSEGKKIEVSTQEVQDSVTPLTVFDRVKASFQRVGSVLRGRGSQNRRRTYSTTKTPDGADSTAVIKNPACVKDERRTSLRGDEQILPALRASRETSEHPLAQSVTASPEIKENHPSFDDSENAWGPASDLQANRPVPPDRTLLSTTDSMKTIRAPSHTISRETSSPNTSTLSDDFSSSTTTVVDHSSNSSSSLSNVFSGAGRRFVNSMRSRERGLGRQSPSQSSRSSSTGDSTENFHASPSLALSSAIAAGHVDQPPALREGPDAHPMLQDLPSEAFRRGQEQNNRRQILEHAQRMCHPPAVSIGAELGCPPSPDDEVYLPPLRPTSAADSTSAFAISSSSDQIGSCDSTSHSRIPSIVSGASSISVRIGEDEETRALALEKSISPLTIGRRRGSHPRGPENRLANPNPSNAKVVAERAAVDDDAGYNGEGEQDSDSDDEGLAMA